MSTDTQQIINKAWNFARVLRDDGRCQSILKRAFEGKLVPHNPKDETVSIPLESSDRLSAGNDRIKIGHSRHMGQQIRSKLCPGTFSFHMHRKTRSW